jgi:hypothetical protein
MECSSGKLSFETFAEAQKVVNTASRQKHHYTHGRRVNRRQNKKPKRVYKCLECGKYHLTSQNK